MRKLPEITVALTSQQRKLYSLFAQEYGRDIHVNVIYILLYGQTPEAKGHTTVSAHQIVLPYLTRLNAHLEPYGLVIKKSDTLKRSYGLRRI